jgi:transcriptional regulator with XRE-family HTH domain
MTDDWSTLVRRYRFRHGLSQCGMAAVMGVSQRTVSRWERGEDKPGVLQQKRLRDLGWQPEGSLFSGLAPAIRHSPAARALTRTPSLTLQSLSGPALAKRPSMANWLGCDLAAIACGILEEILDDRALQRAIQRGEIQTLVTTTRSVLRSAEHDSIGLYRTTISYFFHDGTLYNDATGVPIAEPAAECGYAAVAMDDVPRD